MTDQEESEIVQSDIPSRWRISIAKENTSASARTIKVICWSNDPNYDVLDLAGGLCGN